MPHSPANYLRDIQTYGRRALDYVSTIDLSAYRSSQKTKDAVERNLFVVGEAVTQLRNSFPEVADKLSEVSEIVAFRNILAHGYSMVDDDVVWAVLTDWLPKLVHEAEGLEQMVSEQ